MFAIGQLSRKQHNKTIKKNKKSVKETRVETYEEAMVRLQKDYESYMNSLDERDIHNWSQLWD